MSSEAVKKQILTAISILNIPLGQLPSKQKVVEVSSAAKLLRNRVLREYARVEEHIELLRQKQLYGDSDDEGDDETFDHDYQCNSKYINTNNTENVFPGFSSTGVSSDVWKLTRHDFIFISEMMVMENLVVPLLLAHGMNFDSLLLPQLLKLLTAMLLPVPEHSLEIPRQVDYVRRLVKRCGTDEFFALLIQCVAPVAEKRSTGTLQKEDVVLLEVVLKIITHFFTGPRESIASLIGSFSRNHGVELFLVVLNQNYARSESRKHIDIPPPEIDNRLRKVEEPSGCKASAPDDVVLLEDEKEKGEILLLDGDGEEEEEEEEDCDGQSEASISDARVAAGKTDSDQFDFRMVELFESDEQLWKWNMHIVTAMAAVLRCANPAELAHLGLLSRFQGNSSHQVMEGLANGKKLRECKKESDRWRRVAQSRNGAICSNGLLIRGTPSRRLGGEGGVIGSTLTLLGPGSKDPLEKARDMDLRKKGSFVRGISDDAVAMCSLPLPTKIQLAQQCLSFICYGFEPLNMMVWRRLANMITGLDSIVKERSELLSGLKNSGEDNELPAQLDKAAYVSAKNILDYVDTCASLLSYTREVVRLSNQETGGVPPETFHQQWQSISSIISLDHIHYGLEILRIFSNSPDFKKKFDVTKAATYVAELFMTLNHLIEGDIVRDPSVIAAAHALASSVLYSEENINLIFDVITKSSVKTFSPTKARVLVLLVYSVLRLMERCSFRGSLLFPKREKKKMNEIVTQEADDTERVEFLDSEKLGNNDTFFSLHDKVDEPNLSETALQTTVSSLPSDTSLSLRDAQPDQMTLQSEGWKETFSETASVISSKHAIGSSIMGIEREVQMGNYFRRLAIVKNIKFILSPLRHWKTNDADVNTGLAYLIRSLVAEGCVNIFYSAPFLLVMRDVLANGKHTHPDLYSVCDDVIHNLFNPPYAKILDERRMTQFGSSLGILGGAQSFLGFEVALRCARSLFCFSFSEYNILEEKGLPHLMDSTVIPLAHEAPCDKDLHAAVQEPPAKKYRRKRELSPETVSKVERASSDESQAHFGINE